MKSLFFVSIILGLTFARANEMTLSLLKDISIDATNYPYVTFNPNTQESFIHFNLFGAQEPSDYYKDSRNSRGRPPCSIEFVSAYQPRVITAGTKLYVTEVRTFSGKFSEDTFTNNHGAWLIISFENKEERLKGEIGCRAGSHWTTFGAILSRKSVKEALDEAQKYVKLISGDGQALENK